MLKYLILVTLIACDSGYTKRDPADVGKTITKTGWACLKSETTLHPGYSFSDNGSVILTSSTHCVVSKCIRTVYRLNESVFSTTEVSREIIHDNECL